jgi:predicted ATPase
MVEGTTSQELYLMSQIAETAKFIGRYNEITELASYLEDVVTGQGQIVLINGEAGIGKTRFISEVSSLPIGQRFNWLSAKCISQEGTDPYLPFRDALRNWLGATSKTIEKPVETPEMKPEKVGYEYENLLKMPVIGPKLVEDPSMSFGSFLIKETKSEFSIGILKTLINQGKAGLCITRIPPEQLCNIPDNECSHKLWLSSKPGKNCIPPSLTKISHVITSFLGKNKNSVILMDGLEYIMGHVDFSNVLRFINELIDTMAVHKSILIMPINPLTVDPKQLALLERNMNSIDINSLRTPETPVHEPSQESKEKEHITEDVLKNGRDRMFETTTKQIIDIATVKPVALFIDDLHWADVGALNLLHYLARAVENKSVAIIGAYRPEDVVGEIAHHPLQDLLERLSREKIVKSISLERLDKFETGEIIRSFLNNAHYPEELLNYIHEETEGNPFFVEEVLRALNENGAIKFNRSSNAWILTRLIEEIKLPETVKEVVHARIHKLSKNMRMVLEISSVLGIEFEYDLLSKVANLAEDELVTIIDELIEYKLLIEQTTAYGQPIKYRFAHNKICEVLYNNLSESRKRLLHGKAATAIKEKYQNDLDSVYYELAQHYYHGAVFEPALETSQRAAQKALRNFAPEKAKTFYEWALGSIEVILENGSVKHEEVEGLKTTKREILAKLIEICTIIGEWDEALSRNKELKQNSEEEEDFKKLIDAHKYAGEIHFNRSEWPKAIKNYENALEISKKMNYKNGMKIAYIGIGDVHKRNGDFKTAEKYYKKYMKLIKGTKNQYDVVLGYKSLGDINHTLGNFKRSLNYYQQCANILSKTENYSDLGKIYINMGVTCFELDEFDQALECHEKGIKYGSKIGNIRLMGYGYSNAAEIYSLKHELDKAMDYANKALEIFIKLDEKFMIGMVWMDYGIIYKNKKEWEPARYNFEKSIALLKELNMPYYYADCLRQYGLMLIAQGTVDSLKECRKYLQQSMDLYNELDVEKYTKIIKAELDRLPDN